MFTRLQNPKYISKHLNKHLYINVDNIIIHPKSKIKSRLLINWQIYKQCRPVMKYNLVIKRNEVLMFATVHNKS